MNNKMKVVSGIMVAAMATLTVNLIGSKDVHANTGGGLDRGGNVFNDGSSIPFVSEIDGAETIQMADFNQDGFDDLLTIFDDWDGGGKKIGIYLNQNGKGFVEAWTLSEAECGCEFSNHDFTPADINGDGYPDIVNVLGSSGGSYQALVYINQLGSGLACNTDLNDDGTVNITDLLVLMAAWGDCS